MHGEAGCSQGQPNEDRRNGNPRQEKPKRCTNNPRKWRVEDEARLAGIPGRSEVPVRQKYSLFPLGTDLEPVAEVEFQIVSARGAPKGKREYCERRGQGDEDEVATVSHAPIVRAYNPQLLSKQTFRKGIFEREPTARHRPRITSQGATPAERLQP